MFADAKPDITPPKVIGTEVAAIFNIVLGRAVEVGRATDEARHRFRDRLHHSATRGAGRGL